jgi:hypothetical protein
LDELPLMSDGEGESDEGDKGVIKPKILKSTVGRQAQFRNKIVPLFSQLVTASPLMFDFFHVGQV